jgi:transcriptional regulator of acetoin/glycerol metabolism
LQLPLISSDFAEARDYIQNIFEKQFVSEQLTRYEGNISAAAKASHMSRQNFHRLMVKHKIVLHD